MITDPSHINGVIPLPVYIIILAIVRRLDFNMCAVDPSNDTRKSSLQKEVVFIYVCLVVRWPFYELMSPSVKSMCYISNDPRYCPLVYSGTIADDLKEIIVKITANIEVAVNNAYIYIILLM